MKINESLLSDTRKHLDTSTAYFIATYTIFVSQIVNLRWLEFVSQIVNLRWLESINK